MWIFRLLMNEVIGLDRLVVVSRILLIVRIRLRMIEFVLCSFIVVEKMMKIRIKMKVWF